MRQLSYTFADFKLRTLLKTEANLLCREQEADDAHTFAGKKLFYIVRFSNQEGNKRTIFFAPSFISLKLEPVKGRWSKNDPLNFDLFTFYYSLTLLPFPPSRVLTRAAHRR